MADLDHEYFRRRVADHIDVCEAKSQLSSLLKRVEAGEESVIARPGDPVARLVPYGHVVDPRRPGVWRGRVVLAPDFDELPPEFTAAFGGAGEHDAPAS